MAELQQSASYRKFVKSLGWQVGTIGDAAVYYRRFPIIGGFAKIQRIRSLPDPEKLVQMLRLARIRIVTVEPCDTVTDEELNHFTDYLRKHGFRINRSPYLPTKTFIIPTDGTEKEIFSRLSEAKRRGVRRALKHGVTVRESDDIRMLVGIKQKSAGLFGSITTYGLPQLWTAFRPRNATVLIAYSKTGIPIGGVLLLFHGKTAFYWIAGAVKTGKKMFAPTLLVWEALKVSRARGMKEFDFVGAWDERMPKQNRDWLGFTKFKEGFGGQPKYYPFVR